MPTVPILRSRNSVWPGIVFGLLAASHGFFGHTAALPGAEYHETVDGDLSNSPLAPTRWTLTPGANTLAATSGSNDHDFLTLDVPAGYGLSAVTLDHFPSLNRSFLGLQAGSAWLGATDESIRPADLLGWVHFGPRDRVGTDILPELGSGAGAVGFVPPLASGRYTVFFREARGPESFRMTFQVTAVPEPSWLAWVGCIALGSVARPRIRDPNIRNYRDRKSQ